VTAVFRRRRQNQDTAASAVGVLQRFRHTVKLRFRFDHAGVGKRDAGIVNRDALRLERLSARLRRVMS
jgi:hypothetical protein